MSLCSHHSCRPVYPYTVQIVKYFKVIARSSFNSNEHPLVVFFKCDKETPPDNTIKDFSIKYPN